MVCAVIIRSRIVFSLYAFTWKHTISTSVDDISFFKWFTPSPILLNRCKNTAYFDFMVYLHIKLVRSIGLDSVKKLELY